MNFDIAVLLILLGVATLALAREWLPVDIVTLLLLGSLIISGVLTPSEAFSGFANEIIIILASIFVLSGAVAKTRVLDWLARWLARVGGRTESRMLLVLTSISASLSGFLNNTNTTALLLPATLELSRKRSVSPSRLLMPLAYASMLGGACTLIGTSTNVAASGLLASLGYPAFGLFEFTQVGVTLAIIGVAYLSFVGYRLLPNTEAAELSDKYEISSYLAEIVVHPESDLLEKTLQEARLATLGLNVVRLIRGGRHLFPSAHTKLEADDMLVVHGTRDAMLAAREDPGLQFEAEELTDADGNARQEMQLSEAIVMPQSQLTGSTLAQLRFRQRFGLAVLAVYREGQTVNAPLRDVPLRVGDVLLLEGSTERLMELQGSRDLWVLAELPHMPGRDRKGIYALSAMGAAIAVGAIGWLPLSISLLFAAVAMVLMRILDNDEVYGLIEWKLLVLIGGMTSVGLAMQKTEAADFLSAQVIKLTLPLGVSFVLLTFAVLAMLLTQPLSNAAAVLVLLPVALETATQLGVNPRTFAVMVTLAASLSFITPFEPACLLVYGPGRYRFIDYVKSGGILSAIMLATLMLLVPRVWPL